MKQSPLAPGNFLGAFADCAILFPLLAILSMKAGFSASILLATTGLLYLLAGFFYRIPMVIQPLKSIVIAGVAIQATAMEIRISGALIGMVCLILLFTSVNKWAKRVPVSVIHGIQMGLGLLLILQGAKLMGGMQSGLEVAAILFLSFALVFLSHTFAIPFLGLMAVGIFLWGLWQSKTYEMVPSVSNEVRWTSIVSLILPQMALTLTNSVLAANDVSHSYFGDSAKKVTHSRLLQFIGVGNILTALVGGLPFCHGSGGITAHYRGGASHFSMNIFMGIFLCSFAVYQYVIGSFQLNIAPAMLALLLMVTGIFHIELARATWILPVGKLKLMTMGLVTLFTGNLLWVLLAAVCFEILTDRLLRNRRALI